MSKSHHTAKLLVIAVNAMGRAVARSRLLDEYSYKGLIHSFSQSTARTRRCQCHCAGLYLTQVRTKTSKTGTSSGRFGKTSAKTEKLNAADSQRHDDVGKQPSELSDRIISETSQLLESFRTLIKWKRPGQIEDDLQFLTFFLHTIETLSRNIEDIRRLVFFWDLHRANNVIKSNFSPNQQDLPADASDAVLNRSKLVDQVHSALSRLNESFGVNPDSSEYNQRIQQMRTITLEEGLSLLARMEIEDGAKPDGFTFEAIAINLGYQAHGEGARTVVEHMKQAGFVPSPRSHHAVIMGYSRAGKPGIASKYLETLEREEAQHTLHHPKLLFEKAVAVNTLLDGYARKGLDSTVGRLRELLSQPIIASIQGNLFSAEHQNRLDRILHVQKNVSIKSIIIPPKQVSNRSPTPKVRQQRVLSAWRYVEDMTNSGHPPSTDTFNEFIAYSFKGGHPEIAMDAYSEMQLRGITPDIITFNTLIDFTIRKGMILNSMYYYNQLRAFGFAPNIETYTALIYGFAMYGDMQAAVDAFTELHLSNIQPKAPTLDHHHLLMIGFARLGKFEDVEKYFMSLKSMGHEPDSQTESILAFADLKKGLLEPAMTRLEKIHSKPWKKSKQPSVVSHKYQGKLGVPTSSGALRNMRHLRFHRELLQELCTVGGPKGVSLASMSAEESVAVALRARQAALSHIKTTTKHLGSEIYLSVNYNTVAKSIHDLAFFGMTVSEFGSHFGWTDLLNGFKNTDSSLYAIEPKERALLPSEMIEALITLARKSNRMSLELRYYLTNLYFKEMRFAHDFCELQKHQAMTEASRDTRMVNVVNTFEKEFRDNQLRRARASLERFIARDSIQPVGLTIIYNSMLAIAHKDPNEFQEILRGMEDAGVQYDERTFLAVLNHALMVRKSFDMVWAAWNAYQAYSAKIGKQHRVDAAKMTLTACLSFSQMEKALEVVEYVRQAGLETQLTQYLSPQVWILYKSELEHLGLQSTRVNNVGIEVERIEHPRGESKSEDIWSTLMDAAM